ncbi:uncharacterized protein LOC125097590 [Lutra lutra]|uniref:uncharacterized protein LOC125097590 n=1 Tax=Lutra lutra TaxID=9657 RepID=UPI001FD1882C|nr:uncharacterized protein LOC125097590 [Lutra lutra]
MRGVLALESLKGVWAPKAILYFREKFPSAGYKVLRSAERSVNSEVHLRYRGGPDAQGGKPAREHEGPGPEALDTRPRARAPDLTAAGLQRTRLPLRAVLPSLGRGFGAAVPVAPALGGGRVPADSHWGKGWEIRGLPGEALEFEAGGRRPCMRPRGSPKRKGQSAPACREAAAAAGSLTDCLVCPHPTQPRPRFPRASFGGGAARHNETKMGKTEKKKKKQNLHSQETPSSRRNGL